MVLLPKWHHKGLNRFTSTAPLKNLQNSSQNYIETSGGSKGGTKFLHFHAVFRKNWPNNRLAPPPLTLAPPPLGNPGSATGDQDPGTTQPEGNFTHLNYKFFLKNFLDTQIFPVLVVNSLCKNIFLIFFSKFPVFSLSGKMDFQIPCFPCAVATLLLRERKRHTARRVASAHFADPSPDRGVGGFTPSSSG